MNRFDLTNKYFIITGGTGLLGQKHAEAIAEVGGTPIILDLDKIIINKVVERLRDEFQVSALGFVCDITEENNIINVNKKITDKTKEINGLINNAANNPIMNNENSIHRFEDMSIQEWNDDLNVAITGAFLCSKIFGSIMAQNGSGVIINISSDLGIIAPDQRLYYKENIHEDKQPVKPVTYSVAKHAIIGLTKYLATYWAHKGVRTNTLCPGGVYNGQTDAFVRKISNKIPLQKMANKDDYKGAIQFLCSDASSYMNGATLIIDGGRTIW